MNSGGGGRRGRGPLRQTEKRRDYKRAAYDGSDHRYDGTDPDSEEWP